MEKAGKSIGTFLLGAAVGMAAGYILATDKETRKEDLKKMKDALNNVKDKFSKKTSDLEEEIYH